MSLSSCFQVSLKVLISHMLSYETTLLQLKVTNNNLRTNKLYDIFQGQKYKGRKRQQQLQSNAEGLGKIKHGFAAEFVIKGMKYHISFIKQMVFVIFNRCKSRSFHFTIFQTSQLHFFHGILTKKFVLGSIKLPIICKILNKLANQQYHRSRSIKYLNKPSNYNKQKQKKSLKATRKKNKKRERLFVRR